MLKKPATKRSRIAAATGSVIATTALTFGGLHAIAPTDTMGAEVRTANLTGSFQAEKKQLQVVGQWANSTYEYKRHGHQNSITALESRYQESPQPRQTQQIYSADGSGSQCVYGGDGASGCDDKAARSAAWNRVSPTNIADDFDRSATGYVDFGQIETRVQCKPDGTVEGFKPTGSVKYYGKWVFNYGEKNVTIGNLSATGYSDDFKIARPTNTYIKIDVKPSWGQNDTERRAWSEVVISLDIYNGSDHRYSNVTIRSECGLFMNNNKGSKGAATTSNGAVPLMVDVEYGAELPVAPDKNRTVALETASGLGLPQITDLDGASYAVESSRSLSEKDRQHISTVLKQAAAASAEEGEVEGLAWIRRQANGLPVVTLELPGGGYARVTPEVELFVPEIPQEEAPTPEAEVAAPAPEVEDIASEELE